MLTHLYRDKPGLIAALTAGVGAAVVYALTMSRSVGWHDSAELALIAWSLGASHAPGSPLHSLLGHIFIGFFSKPYIATTLLSVLSMSTAVACAALMLTRLRCGRLVAVAAALMFAFSFQVWAGAVITEVYGLGAMLLAGALLAALGWETSRSGIALGLMTVLYSAAMAAYFANVLLGPLFLWFVYRVSGSAWRPLLVFILGTGSALTLIVAANYLLAANAFPFGSVLPDTPYNMWFYMSGSQYDPLQLRSLDGFGLRLVEHLEIFLRSSGYVAIPLAIGGAIRLHQQNRTYNLLLLGVFSIYMVYYTFFGSGDYFLMVVPAYLVLALWAGMGAAWLGEQFSNKWLRSSGALVLLLLVTGLVLFQIEGRRTMAFAATAERFAADAFEQLPPDTLAIAGWRELTTLVYLQQVEDLRPDVRFILPAVTPRYYLSGRVDNFMDEVAGRICKTPVFTLKQPDELLRLYDIGESLNATAWVAVRSKQPCN